MRKAWLWWSTGKDSAWALHRLQTDSDVSVERLVTTVTPRFGRVAIHGTRIEILEAQAAALGLPLEIIELPFPCSNDEYVEAVTPFIEAAGQAEVDLMAFGDLFLEDVRDYRISLLADSAVQAYFPIWGEDTTALATEIIDSGAEIVVTSLDPSRVPRELAGARYDSSFLGRLPAAVDACGENGEFHTCITSGPLFAEPLRLRRGEVVERDGFVYCDFVLEGG